MRTELESHSLLDRNTPENPAFVEKSPLKVPTYHEHGRRKTLRQICRRL